MSPRAAWRLESLGFKQVFEYAAGLADWAAAGLPFEGTTAAIPTIGEIARQDVPVAHLGDPIGEVARNAESADWATVLVVNDQKVVLGRLFKSQLDMYTDASVESVMKAGPSTFRPNTSVEEMAEFMRQNELETAPVTTSEGILVGMVLRKDVDRALDQLHRSHQH